MVPKNQDRLVFLGRGFWDREHTSNTEKTPLHGDIASLLVFGRITESNESGCRPEMNGRDTQYCAAENGKPKISCITDCC